MLLGESNTFCIDGGVLFFRIPGDVPPKYGHFMRITHGFITLVQAVVSPVTGEGVVDLKSIVTPDDE